MGKSTYDNIQEILMNARLETGKAATGNGGMQLTDEERRALQAANGISDWDEMHMTLAEFEKFLRS